MHDTMGRAAGLTGGYGSTYSQGVGQQAYDETMRGLTDKIPELEDRAFQRYKEQGDQIMTQFNIANQLGAADQATRQRDQEWDFTQRQYADQQSQYQDKQRQQAYENLSSAILTSGYQPTSDELTASGMTKEQADALRQAWVVSNPGQAWMLGLLTADQYLRLTGEVAPGSVVAGGGGGGGYGGGGGGSAFQQASNALQAAVNSGATREETNTAIMQNPSLSSEEKRQLISGNTAPINYTPPNQEIGAIARDKTLTPQQKQEQVRAILRQQLGRT